MFRFSLVLSYRDFVFAEYLGVRGAGFWGSICFGEGLGRSGSAVAVVVGRSFSRRFVGGVVFRAYFSFFFVFFLFVGAGCGWRVVL